MAFKSMSLLAVAMIATIQVEAEPIWDVREAIERTGHGHLLERDIHCTADVDCCEYCTCIVTDPIHRKSDCVHIGLANLNENYSNESNEDGENTERGSFEIGYWCLKDSDCAIKRCAQVGPRKYDKEC